MIDPSRHHLPEVVLDALRALTDGFSKAGCADPHAAGIHMTTMVVKYWGGLQAYVPAVGNASNSSRFCDELKTWCTEYLMAVQMDAEEAHLAADIVVGTFRQVFSGFVLYLPQDKWSWRKELSDRFNGHNMVDMCREYRLTTSNFYKILFEERNCKAAQKTSA